MKFNLDKDRKRSIIRLVPFIGIVLIISFLIFNHKQQQQQAELAYKDTKKALELLITNLDRGRGKIAHLNQFDITLKKIYNH